MVYSWSVVYTERIL